MSLWRQRKQIDQALAGLLSAEDELKLRAHLSGCAECRRHYDLLSMQARILAGDPHAMKAPDERELARLLAGITPAPAPAPVRPRGWIPAIAFAVASAAVFVALFGLKVEDKASPTSDVTWRGVADAGAAEGFELLMFTAPLDGGALEQKANFPLDAVARIHRDQWVAFAPRAQSRKFGAFRAVLIDERGEVLVLESGHSVSLDPGRWRVIGVEALRLSDDPLKRAAATGLTSNRLTLDEGIQSYGEILVEP